MVYSIPARMVHEYASSSGLCPAGFGVRNRNAFCSTASPLMETHNVLFSFHKRTIDDYALSIYVNGVDGEKVFFMRPIMNCPVKLLSTFCLQQNMIVATVNYGNSPRA